jgi:hypothetical protein
MNIQTAKNIISAAAIADDTVILEGVHGIGKSQIVNQFATENDYHIEELFLSHNEIGDLIGIPHIVQSDGLTLTTWSVPIWLQRLRNASKNGKKCILFLDELNRAQTDVRQSAMQLVLERKIHEHELPVTSGSRTLIVAAINPADQYQVDELDTALLDRFLHVKIEPDAESWLKWARKSGINDTIIGFISEHPDRLHWLSSEGTGATPRSWAKLSNYLNNADKISNDILFQVMKGKIGTEVASQFYVFFKNYKDSIKITDIENLILKHKNSVSTIEELGSYISEKISKIEAIQKIELANQLSNKYGESDIFYLLCYLYSLEIEICISFLKSLKKNEPDVYKKLAQYDSELNNKNLFKRIIQSSDRK